MFDTPSFVHDARCHLLCVSVHEHKQKSLAVAHIAYPVRVKNNRQ